MLNILVQHSWQGTMRLEISTEKGNLGMIQSSLTTYGVDESEAQRDKLKLFKAFYITDWKSE